MVNEWYEMKFKNLLNGGLTIQDSLFHKDQKHDFDWSILGQMSDLYLNTFKDKYE